MLNNLQFYLKCQNTETGKITTYRFCHQQDLLSFSNELTKQNMAIIDSHIAFFNIDLLFNPFTDNFPIDSGDINTALDGKIALAEWLNQC